MRAASRSENTICLPRTLLRRRAGTPPSVGTLALLKWQGASDLGSGISEAEPALGVCRSQTIRREEKMCLGACGGRGEHHYR